MIVRNRPIICQGPGHSLFAARRAFARAKKGWVGAQPASGRALIFILDSSDIDFDVDVGEAVDTGKFSLVRVRRARVVGDDRRQHPEMARPQPPYMQVDDPVAVALEPPFDQGGAGATRDGIEQYRSR